MAQGSNSSGHVSHSHKCLICRTQTGSSYLSLKRQTQRYERMKSYSVRVTKRQRVKKLEQGNGWQMSMQMLGSCLCPDTLRGGQTWGTWHTEDSVASDVGDGTFAVFLQSYFYIGGGNVAFLAALLPRPRPAIAFILFDDVQNLKTARWGNFKWE